MAAPQVSFAEKTPAWTKLRSPNFLVYTNAGEKPGRRVAYQFEMIRAVFHRVFNIKGSATDPPVTIIAAKDEAKLGPLLPEYFVVKGSNHRTDLRGMRAHIVNHPAKDEPDEGETISPFQGLPPEEGGFSDPGRWPGLCYPAPSRLGSGTFRLAPVHFEKRGRPQGMKMGSRCRPRKPALQRRREQGPLGCHGVQDSNSR